MANITQKAYHKTQAKPESLWQHSTVEKWTQKVTQVRKMVDKEE